MHGFFILSNFFLKIFPQVVSGFRPPGSIGAENFVSDGLDLHRHVPQADLAELERIAQPQMVETSPARVVSITPSLTHPTRSAAKCDAAV
jgi:hypothetical protein